MARIKDSSVDAVKNTVTIVDVVGTRTQLRKSGARYVGLCPFHEERTPSFSVNAEEGFYYCFGCQKGGDAITFVEETEQVDFVGAIEWLAQRFNVPLEYEEASPEQDERRRHRERLYALLEQAASFYERFLWDSGAGETARAYLESRGLAEEVCREYRLGLAPVTPTLARKAAEKGFTRAELDAAGLANRRGNDYFSGRLLFPIADARGRVVGFQARRLRDDDPLKAKYVNSPEGELFRKRDLLYGLDRARAAIAREERAVVVEGNTDVLALKQVGLVPVVAPMGTALTERQVKELARLTHRIYLCFDADAAGQAATLRGMEIAAAQGLDVRVVTLEPDTDPADAAEGFEERLPGAEKYLKYRVRLTIERSPDRQDAYALVRDFLRRFEESPDRQDALQYAADRLSLTAEMQASVSASAATLTASVSPKLLEAGERLERDALAGCFAHPETLPLLAELSPEHFDVELHRRARDHLVNGTEPDRDLTPVLAELNARAEAEGIDEETTKELLLRLRIRQIRRELPGAEGDHLRELQEALNRIRSAASELVWANAGEI